MAGKHEMPDPTAQRAGPATAPPDTFPPFGDLDVQSLSPPIRKLVKALLLYKSMFVGPWFAALSVEEDDRTRELYDTIIHETTDQAKRAAALLRKWDASGRDHGTDEMTEHVLKRLLDDMLSLKRSSTEVFLGAGIDSPTEEMRRAFLELADIDRRHAEALRAALGVHLPTTKELKASTARSYAGVHVGPFAPGTVSGTLEQALDDARAAGQDPTRIVMSSRLLRHLRDEGSVAPQQGEVFGLPVDIDFSWDGESFSISSRSRVSLAEIVTEMESTWKPKGEDQRAPKT